MCKNLCKNGCFPPSMDFSYKKPAHLFAFLVLIGSLTLIIIPSVLTYLGLFPTTSDIQLSEPLILFSMIISVCIFLGVPLIWYILVNNFTFPQMLKDLQLKKHNLPLAVFWSIIAISIMYIILIAAGIILTQFGIIQEEITNVQDLTMNLSLPALLLIVIIQSPVEEIFFRGFLLTKLNSITGPHTAVFYSAVIFGLAHLSYGKLYPAIMSTILGIILGYALIKSKNLFSVIIAHLLFNLSSVVIYIFSESIIP